MTKPNEKTVILLISRICWRNLDPAKDVAVPMLCGPKRHIGKKWWTIQTHSQISINVFWSKGLYHKSLTKVFVQAQHAIPPTPSSKKTTTRAAMENHLVVKETIIVEGVSFVTEPWFVGPLGAWGWQWESPRHCPELLSVAHPYFILLATQLLLSEMMKTHPHMMLQQKKCGFCTLRSSGILAVSQVGEENFPFVALCHLKSLCYCCIHWTIFSLCGKIEFDHPKGDTRVVTQHDLAIHHFPCRKQKIGLHSSGPKIERSPIDFHSNLGLTSPKNDSHKPKLTAHTWNRAMEHWRTSNPFCILTSQKGVNASFLLVMVHIPPKKTASSWNSWMTSLLHLCFGSISGISSFQSFGTRPVTSPPRELCQVSTRFQCFPLSWT